MKSYKSILIIIKNNRKLIKKNIYPNLKKELKSIFSIGFAKTLFSS
jgi:hypothetical protein